MVSGHSCIRVHKMALPLIERGHDVHLIAKKYVGFANNYKSFSLHSNIDQCVESIRLHTRDADVFHVHNEPSWFVCAIKELTDKPVLLDVHDSYLTRSTREEAAAAHEAGKPHVRITAEERAAFQLADALNFPSEHLRRAVADEFRIDAPTMVLPSYVPRSLYKYHFKEWMGGLVYEGRVTIPSEHEGLKGGTGANYCDYLNVAKACDAIGMNFHLYAGRNDAEFMKAYDDIAYVHPGYSYADLLDRVTRHDWGLVGNTVSTPQWNVAVPNKMFDYLAAGVPSVCINAQAASELLEEHGFGMTVSGIDELAARWSEHTNSRKKLFRAREVLSMENHISKLTDLYQTMRH